MNFQLKSFLLNQFDKISLKLIIALFIVLLTPILFFLIRELKLNLCLVSLILIILFSLVNVSFMLEEYDKVKDLVGNNLKELFFNKKKSVFLLFLGSITISITFGMIILKTILARTTPDMSDIDFSTILYPILIIIVVITFEKKYILDEWGEVKAANEMVENS